RWPQAPRSLAASRRQLASRLRSRQDLRGDADAFQGHLRPNDYTGIHYRAKKLCITAGEEYTGIVAAVLLESRSRGQLAQNCFDPARDCPEDTCLDGPFC